MRALSLMLLVAGCGLSSDDVDASVAVHAADAAAHGGPFATPAAVDVVLTAHNADDEAHAGTFVKPDELDDAIAAHDADAAAHGGPHVTPVELDVALAGHDGDADAHAGLLVTPADLEAHDQDGLAHANLVIEPGQLPLSARIVSIPFSAALATLNTSLHATGFGGSGLAVGEGGKFAVPWVVPADFEDRSATLRVTWRIADVSCDVALYPNFIDRNRDGSGRPGGSAAAGFSGPLRPIVAGATPWIGGTAEYTVSAGGGYVDVQAGDNLIFGLYRGADSCTSDIYITGLSVSYLGR